MFFDGIYVFNLTHIETAIFQMYTRPYNYSYMYIPFEAEEALASSLFVDLLYNLVGDHTITL